MTKLTPVIVIEAKEINACEDCPYFEKEEETYYNYGLPLNTHCQHPAIRGAYGKTIPTSFPKIKGTDIWIECPLPDASTQ
jgi:hypothetical protein